MFKKPLGLLGVFLIIVGIGYFIGAGVAFSKTQGGYGSLEAFSAAQNVELSFNEDGQLIDRGTTEGADAIMELLTEDWNYPVVDADLDPNDPLVNTATEYMYQMATIGYHVLHGTQEVTLDEAVEYEGETFAPGTYEFDVDGRYWTGFDRMHPIEGPAREQAWTGTVHGLFGELGVGTVTHSTLQMGLAMAALFAGVGLTFMLTGGGVLWAARAKKEDDDVRVPDTIPEEMVAEHKDTSQESVA